MPAPQLETIIARQQLQEELRALEISRKRWIREQVLENRRLDVLAGEVFDLDIKPFHRAMQQFALKHGHSLQLAFRGSGKSTTVTITLCILHMLLNPDVRILLCSRTSGLAQDLLHEIKQHLESDKFQEIFGDLTGPTWGKSAITIAGRTKPIKEPSIFTVGAEGQLVGKHFDVIFCDDLVDEANARTSTMREHVKTFFYKTLMPTLEPDGELHVIGTRYHFDDLYGHLLSSELATHHQIIPALKDGKSPWPEKYPVKWLHAQRRRLGSISFDTQYQLDTDKMRGGIFQWDWMQEISDPAEIEALFPEDKSRIFIGVDPSVGESSGSDFFAMVVIRVCGRKVLVEKYLERHLTITKQIGKMVEWYDEWDPIEMTIESNGYQAVLAQKLREDYPRVRARASHTSKDKEIRGVKLSARFEAGDVYFRKGLQHLIDHLVLFPKGSHDDLFDATEFAFARAFRRSRRKKRETEVGLI